MNRRDSSRDQQSAGQPGDERRWDVPRQSGQWQDGPRRQSGGDWGHDDDPRDAGAGSDDTGWHGEGGGRDAEPRNDPSTSDYHSGPARGSGGGERGAGGHDDNYPIPNYDAAGGNRFSNFTSEDYGGRDFSSGRSGITGGMSPSNSYRPTFSFHRRARASRDDYKEWREYGERRGFLRRAGDEIASWFGNESAAHRRELDHSGRGPADYTRSDERISEDVNDSLTGDWRLDARNVRVSVAEGEVTLDGTVASRADKRLAEDLADDISGVRHVQNNLRIDKGARGRSSPGGTGSSSTGEGTS